MKFTGFFLCLRCLEGFTAVSELYNKNEISHCLFKQRARWSQIMIMRQKHD